MERIITTVTVQNSSIPYDMEMPTDLLIEKLLDDIVQALLGQDSSLSLRLSEVELFSERLNHVLDRKKTLWEEGIWNGDYLEIRRVHVSRMRYFSKKQDEFDVLNLNSLYASEW